MAGGGTVMMPHPVNSMAVKEFYDGTTVVGHAAMLKVDAGAGAATWQYYCKGPAGRCYAGSLADTASFAKNDNNCGLCHGGFIFTNPSAP